MEMANFEIPENPEYSDEMRRLERTDPADAELFNGMFAQLLNNEAFLKALAEAAVNKYGDTMYGNLQIHTDKDVGYPTMVRNFPSDDNTCSQIATSFNNTDEIAGLQIVTNNEADENGSYISKNTLKLFSKKNGATQNFNIFGEHNKPTPEDIEALASLANYYNANSGIDIDTITDTLMLVAKELFKVQPIDSTFIFILQFFYGSISSESNRVQVAFPYGPATCGNIAIRKYFDGVWSEWISDLTKADVVDNLLSEANDLPLSANQGRILNNKLSKPRTLLWTNPNPLAEFSAQTLNIDLTEYKQGELEIEFARTTAELYLKKYDKILIEGQAQGMVVYLYSGKTMERGFSISSDCKSIEFYNGALYDTYGVSSPSGTYVVPLHIFATKRNF